jgi:hypothetical protein
MHDFSVWAGHAHDFGSAKNRFVEIDGLRGVPAWVEGERGQAKL